MLGQDRLFPYYYCFKLKTYLENRGVNRAGPNAGRARADLLNGGPGSAGPNLSGPGRTIL